MQKIVKANTGKKRTPEARKRMGLAHVGKYMPTQGFQKGHTLGKRFQKGFTPWNKGKNIKINQVCPTCSASFLINPNIKQVYCSKKCVVRNWKIVRNFGPKHHNWKGGVSKDVHNISEPKYKEWRMNVFKRDNFCCKICRSKKDLQVHHILRWADFPELRYDINNGIALCRIHHPRKVVEEKRLIPTFVELVSVSKENY